MQITKARESPPYSLERMLEELWKPEHASFVPTCDLFEDKEGYTVQMELAGMTPKDIQVEMDGNLLTVRGEKKWEDEKRERSYYRIERRYGSFFRQIQLPESANVEKAQAAHKDGVLTIRFPKCEQTKKRAVSIQVK
jgi:HSP20 family protein